MGYIFNPDGFDWMNIRLTKDNDYTYHHIEEVKKGGKTTVENGAILTEISHRFLHILEAYCPKAYNDLQNVFMTINARMEPPSFELMKEIDQILYDIFYTEKYHISEEDLPIKAWKKFIETRAAYETSRHILRKCLT